MTDRELMQMSLDYLIEFGMGEMPTAKALRDRLAQPEPEPVTGKGKELSEQMKLCARNVAFAASGRVDMSSAAMQEMFALIDYACIGIDSPQPKRKWVGLTDEERADCWSSSAVQSAINIEAKLKEKNT